MQVEALINAGVAADKIFVDELSGAKEAKERPGMQALMDYAREATMSISGGWTGSAGPSSTC